jgi:PleD family two-component response regulator
MNAAAEPRKLENSPMRTVGPRAKSNGNERDGSPGASQRPVVLIVDDVPNNLLALEGMLRRDDVAIVTAPSGPAALEVLLERHVAVAIIDVQMPEMDGFELAPERRDHRTDPPQRRTDVPDDRAAPRRHAVQEGWHA